MNPMNPISFSCSHCSQGITMPPDAAGRAVPCPHCKQAILVPDAPPARSAPTPVKVSLGGKADLGPDFTETLRKAREATDSIFHDQDDEGDSLFGGSDTPRKLFVPPPVAVTSQTPTGFGDLVQPTLRVPGLPSLPPIASGLGTSLATSALYVPVAAPAAPLNPFEDLSTGPSAEASGDLEPIGAMVEENEESEVAIRRSFPWKNVLIVTLALYALAITALTGWGWLRTPEAPKGTPANAVGKH